MRRTFRAHLPLYAVAVAVSATLAVLARTGGLTVSIGPGLLFGQMLAVMITVAFGFAAIRELFRLIRFEKPASPLRAMGSWLLRGLTHGDRAGNALHGVIIFVPLLIAFAALKTAIPGYNPFAWDVTFAQLDQALHFGWQPWEILQPVLGWPVVTFLLNFAYNLWFVVLFAVLIWQIVARQAGRTRMQFLLAFALAWFVGGNALATLFSSAGPCFYGRLGLGGDPYAPLMTYLAEASRSYPVWSLAVQDTLWANYVGHGGEIAGISAMPSMHVTTATLMAILGWHTSRRLGAALTIFALLIGLGSVHLGWHYAVDAYAGVGLAFLFWAAAGLVVRSPSRSAPDAASIHAYPAALAQAKPRY